MIIIFTNKNGDQITLDPRNEAHKDFIGFYAEKDNWSAYLEKDGDVKALTREEVLAKI